MMKSKVCSTCRKRKLIHFFSKEKVNKDGYRGQCKKCRKKWENTPIQRLKQLQAIREWKLRNNDKVLLQHKKRKKNINKDQLINPERFINYHLQRCLIPSYRKTAPCTRCGKIKELLSKSRRLCVKCYEADKQKAHRIMERRRIRQQITPEQKRKKAIESSKTYYLNNKTKCNALIRNWYFKKHWKEYAEPRKVLLKLKKLVKTINQREVHK